MSATRFAPSPTGYLHLGHAFSALLNHDEAVRRGGAMILRIEDIDRGRSRDVFDAAILEDLSWLGISWPEPVWRQSERMGVYQEAREELAERGLLYRCFKTRAELSALVGAPHGPEPKRPATAPLPKDQEDALLAEGKPYAWRLDGRRAAESLGTMTLPVTLEGEERQVLISGLGDPVLARKDFPTSYHIASVIDDAAQEVELIWRGEDLSDALPLHRLLQELFGLPAPEYRHHRLILNEDGKRLAKRDRSETLRSLRDNGVTPQEVRQRLGLPSAP